MTADARLSSYTTSYNEKYGETLRSFTPPADPDFTVLESLVLSGTDYKTDNFIYTENENIIYLDTSIQYDHNSSQITFTNYGNNDLGIYKTSGTSGDNCYHTLSNSGDAVLYGVQDRSNGVLSTGESREYGVANGDSSDAAFSITIKNGGWTSEGEYIDVVITYQYAFLYRYRAFNGETTEYPCLMHLFEGQPIFDIMTMESMQDQSMFEINISFYYADDGSLVDDAAFVFAVEDLDISQSTTERNGLYSESIWFVDGFDHDIEITKDPESILQYQRKQYSNNDSTYNGSVTTSTYGYLSRLYPGYNQSSDDTSYANETLGSGFKTEITSGSFTFLWTGQGCGTEISLAAGGYDEPDLDDPVKTVDNTSVSVGDNITYTVTETIAYTYDNGTYDNTYSSIVFSDTLSSLLDANMAYTTFAIYRTDTLNGSARVSDKSNWNISINGQTITATLKTSALESAGGEYEFVFTTQVVEEATATISNTAYFYYNNHTLTSNLVSTDQDPAYVEYKLVSTNNPADSTLPSKVTSVAGAAYTIENGLTTSYSGWYFDGWYYDSSLTQPASGTITLPSGTTTLYGSWSKSSISLTKTASVSSITGNNATVGYTVTYTYNITNTGETDLTNLTLYDNKIGNIALSVSSLTSGQSTTATATYNITQTDINNGYVYNTATVTGKNPGGSNITATDNANVTIEQNPGISLTKTASTYTVNDAKAGTTTITYTFKITNTGNVTLKNLTLTDAKLGGSVSLSSTSLSVGSTMTATKVYTITQDDIDTGSIYNTATVIGYSPLNKSVSDTDNCTVTVTWSPDIDIEKTSASGSTIENARAGDTVNYNITVTNTGNVTLNGFTIYDTLDGVTLNLTNVPSTLAPDKSFTVTATYTLTQEDIDRGYIDNHAFVTSKTPDGGSGPDDDDDETVTLPPNPSISLVKTANVELVENAWAGTSTITYSFTVTNTGNVTLDDIILTDPMIGSAAITLYDASGSTVSTLAPDEQAFGTATYTLTQDDIDAGIVENTATVVGDDPSDTTVNDTDDEDVEVERLPSIDLVKEVVGDIVIEDAYAGDWVQFAVTITNTGNTTLYNATISDLLEGATFVVEELDGVTFTEDNTVIVEKMSPEDSVTVYVDYQLLQSDVDRGDTENIASVVADPPTGLDQVTDDDDAMIETPSNPSISLVKTANVESIEFALPGDVIYYTLTITNTGNTTISNLALYDELLAGELEVFVGGEDDAENSDDTVDAEADGETNDDVAGDTDGSEDEVDETDDVDDNSVIVPYSDVADESNENVVSDASDENIEADTGDGNNNEGDDVSAEDETVVEDETLVSGDITVALDTLIIAPGESAVAILSYTLTQDDIDAGYVYNTASATGEDPHGTGVEDEDDYTVTLIPSPSLLLTKTVAAANDVADEDLTVGDELTYTLVIANNGNQTITDITLYDELLGGDIDLTNAVKGIDMTVIGYEPTEEETSGDDVADDSSASDDETTEIDDDTVLADSEDAVDGDTNTSDETDAAASDDNVGIEPLGSVGDETDDGTGENDSSAAAETDAEVTGDAVDIEGESAEETEETVVSDSTLTISSRAYYTEHTEISEEDPITTLRPGEYLIIEVNYTLTQDDLDNGRVDNTATTTGIAPDGSSVADENTAVMYLPQHPSIELIKDASLETLTAARVDDIVYYTLTITNTGDVSLTNITITDDLEGVVVDTSTIDGLVLAPGEMVVVTAEYALTDADIQSGSVYNHATVLAESVVPSDEGNIWSGAQQVSDDDDAIIEGIIAAAVADDLILAQTGENILLMLVSVCVGLIATASVAAGYVGKQRRIK